MVDRMPREQNTLEVVGPNPISGVHKMVLLDTSDFTEKKFCLHLLGKNKP